MPTGAIDLYRLEGVSLSNGTYPLRGGTDPTPWKTVTGRYLTDLRQSIKLPYQAGMESVNILRFGGAWWWVLSMDTSTDQGRSVVMVVSYNAPTSLLIKGTTVNGAWGRLPTSSARIQRQAISSPMEHTKTWELPKLPKSAGQIYWVQATVQETATGGDATLTHRLGCFVTYSEAGDTSEEVAYATGKSYPSLADILTDAEGVYGVTADSILDISISVRCPWQWTYASGGVITLDSKTATAISVREGSKGVLYEIDKDPAFLAQVVGWSTFMTLDGITDLEYASGQITLRTEDTATVASYTPTTVSAESAWQIYTISDLTGVYTYIKANGYLSCIQEGHLPWSGTSWEQYRAYQLAYDRQAMEQSIDYAHQRQSLAIAEAGVNTLNSVAMGAMGGNPLSIITGAISGVAGLGIQTWASGEEQRIADSEARDTQALAERRAMGGPSTPYNTGYGLIYCATTVRTPASIWLEMPKGLTTELDDAYTAWFGHPSDHVGRVTVGAGYYRGEIYGEVFGHETGPRYDRLVEVARNGFRFKEV